MERKKNHLLVLGMDEIANSEWRIAMDLRENERRLKDFF